MHSDFSLNIHFPLDCEIQCGVCVVIPFILDVRLVDVPGGVTQEEGHTGLFLPPSFCGACLNFSREKESAVPFPRRQTVKSNFVYY